MLKSVSMKNDPALSSIINFLLPIIFLYGCFFFVGFFDAGFFAFIYSLVLFASGLLVFYISSSNLKLLARANFENVGLFVVLVSLVYVMVLLFSVTNFFSV